MSLKRLSIAHFRNITAAELEFSPTFNLIVGENGSGKTSLLEALYYLGRVKSFRTRQIGALIQHAQPAFRLIGQLGEAGGHSLTIGIERHPRSQVLRMGGEQIRRLAELVRVLPIQLLTQDSHLLLEGGPRYRRRFLDWGMFHVEPRFYETWQHYSRTLKQRNAALRQGRARQDVETWNAGLIESALELDRLRRAYLEALRPYIDANLASLVHLPDLDFRYQPGWPAAAAFEAQLQEAYPDDSRRGFTQLGPHRADLQPRIGDVPAVERISRGQQKQLVTALLLAQAELMMARNRQRCLFLIDDLAAELDPGHRQRLFDRLRGLESQIFITATESAALPDQAGAEAKRFHVEHGSVTEMV